MHCLFCTITVRYNLDPEGIKDDKELWEALDLAQLKEFTETLDKRLGMSTILVKSHFKRIVMNILLLLHALIMYFPLDVHL